MVGGQCVFRRSLLLFSLLHVAHAAALVEVSRSFTIDYENDQFLLNGSPFRYVSGSLHYFRVPRAYWRDRLHKLRAAGLNAVSTYVDWSQHEPSPGHFEFSGELDLQHFIQLAQEEDLLVLLRPGPYICAERDMGGFPPWLLTVKPDIYLRTNDTTYMGYVERYLNYLMTSVQAQLYGNGGPIIMVQIENEYGSYKACNSNYQIWLRDVFKRIVGNAAILYTTDGAAVSYLRCGKIEGVYATVDFGTSTDVDTAFLAQRIYEPHGPLVNSELYVGWLTHWGETFQKVGTDAVVNTLDKMLARNASVNLYMFFGGTNFGFLAGANYGDKYQPQLTSYDYDAPLSEAGDPTSKYFAIKEVIGRYLPQLNNTAPTYTPKGNYDTVILSPIAPLLDQRIRQELGSQPVRSQFPLTFEELGQRYGFVLYETMLARPVSDPALFSIPGISDRAIVLLDDVPKGILSRSENITAMPLSVSEGTKISVLVENQGRINYGSFINDSKGLVSNATLGGEVLEDWIITGFPLHDISRLSFSNNTNYTFSGPTFFRGTFTLPESYSIPLDTYLDPRGWGKTEFLFMADSMENINFQKKGVVFINGFNLGRYWPILGPQVTLYVPGCHLKPYPALNELILLELEKANSPQYNVSFIPEPILDKQPPAHTLSNDPAHFLMPLQLNQGPAPQPNASVLVI